MNDAVVADGLTKRYGHTVALDRCSFAIPAHTIVALVGPNGSGKSTLLHCATGLVQPTEGTITVLDGPAGDRTLPRVGFVAQDAPLYRDFTADELLTMGVKLNNEFDLSLPGRGWSTWDPSRSACGPAVGRTTRTGGAVSCPRQTTGAAAVAR